MNKEFITVTAEFNVKEKLTFFALNPEGKMVGTLIMQDEELKFYNKETNETTKYDPEEFEDFVRARGLRFHKAADSQFVKFNPNPKGLKTGDCSIRAYCKAEGLDWDEAFDIAMKYGKAGAALPDDAKIVETILTQEFGYDSKPLKGEQRCTVNEFALANPIGTYVLGVSRHVVAVVDGKYYDSWDSGSKKVTKVFTKSVVE